MKKIIVIGCGNIFTSFHYPILKKLNHTIVGIVEPNLVNFQNFISNENLSNINHYESIDLVDFKGVDVALICSPSAFHGEMMKFLMAEDVAIFCEKPILTNYKTIGEELLLKASNYSNTIQTGYYRRFSNASIYIKSLIEKETFGKVNYVNMKGGWPAKNDLPFSITNKKMSGGGITMDYGAHFIDHCLYWFKEVELESYADDSKGGIEVNSQIIFKHQDNFSIQIDLSWTNFMGNFIQLNFEKAIIFIAFNNPNAVEIVELNYQTQNMLVDRNISKKTTDTKKMFVQKTSAESQWIEFFDRMNGGYENYSSLKDAFEVSNLISKCYENRTELSLDWGY